MGTVTLIIYNIPPVLFRVIETRTDIRVGGVHANVIDTGVLISP